MPAVTPFRLVVLLALGAAAWFGFSGKSSFSRSRRAPITVDAIPDACSADGQFAMTFDEGPSSYTVGVLNALRAANIKATFHFTTEYIKDITVNTNMRSAYEAGHVIGLRVPNSFDASKASENDIKQKLLNGAAAIYTYLKVYPKFVRFPVGTVNELALKVCADLGFVISSFNIDSMDYDAKANLASIQQKYVDQLSKVQAGKGRYIAGHHDLIPLYQNGVIESLVKLLANYGYSPVTLDTCLATSGAYRAENVDPKGSVVAVDPSGKPVDGTLSAKSSDAFRVSQTGLFALVFMQVLFFML
eukprot:Partr_v1_DN25396_c1_g1_i1_m21679 putative chitin deacetylase